MNQSWKVWTFQTKLLMTTNGLQNKTLIVKQKQSFGIKFAKVN